MSRTPKIVVTERKLGREGAHGQITPIEEEGGLLIEIDPRNTARQRLDTVPYHVG